MSFCQDTIDINTAGIRGRKRKIKHACLEMCVNKATKTRCLLMQFKTQ